MIHHIMNLYNHIIQLSNEIKNQIFFHRQPPISTPPITNYSAMISSNNSRARQENPQQLPSYLYSIHQVLSHPSGFPLLFNYSLTEWSQWQVDWRRDWPTDTTGTSIDIYSWLIKGMATWMLDPPVIWNYDSLIQWYNRLLFCFMICKFHAE